jgi:DNA mismatch repair protein MutS
MIIAANFCSALETRERERTGIANLKVEFNRVHGFYIEVTNAHTTRIPDDYRRRQTLKNAERYITPELKTFEDKALSAQERAQHREKLLFERLLVDLAPSIPALQKAAAALAALDVLSTLAERAEALDLVRPDVRRRTWPHHPCRPPSGCRTTGRRLYRQRSPAASRPALADHHGPEHGWQVDVHAPGSGNRAAGVLRRVCAGGRCEIGPLDAIHTRIGAADDLAGGRSTFMVEMTEAAAILHRATPLSLVLIDEIGRGTSTFDGLALAWAIAHQLAGRNRCLALFATHYFELTALPAEIDGCANIHFDAVLHGDGIVFLHAGRRGSGQSELRVAGAKLAGVPADAVRRARAYLSRLDKFNAAGGAQADLFTAPVASGAEATNDASVAIPSGVAQSIAAQLAVLDPDAMTPRDALAALYELMRLLK